MKLKLDNEDLQTEKKECKQCGRYLSKDYHEELCPKCIELNLFSAVRDYIRSKDVREMDVANHFNIPVTKVRSWIREGKIVYKTSDGRTISGVYCQMCGKKIDFGTVCAECRKLQQLQVVSKQYGEMKADEMHFLGRGDDKDK